MSGSADEITNFNQYNQLRIIPHRNDPCLIRGGDGDFSSLKQLAGSTKIKMVHEKY